MKTRNLFLSLFAFAALCACNKEAQPEVPQILEEDAYINVSIVSDNFDTKAATEGSFLVGSAKENDVTNALFAFFDNSGKYLYSVNDKSITWSDATSETPAVERISYAVVVLEKQSITPTQMVVVLNYGNDIAEYFDDDNNGDIDDLDDMYKVLHTSNLVYNDCFTMSNSSYWEGGKNAFAAQITESNIYSIPEGSTESEKAAIRSAQTPVEVYVERVAAKLSVAGNPTGTNKPLELINGTIIEYYPVIKNYGFTYTTDASWLCKNIEGLDTKLTSTWAGWNAPTHKRSYWAENYTSANINKLEFGDITGVLSGTPIPSYDVYCHENTTGNPTKLIVSASIKNAADDSDLEIVRVGTNEYYIKDELLTAIANKFVTASISKADATTFTKDDFEIVKSEALDAKSYESDIKIKTGSEAEAGKDTEVDAILNDYKKVLYWGDKVYFYTDIEHFGTATGTDKGVVRNHIYQLTVSSIAGLGTPYVPGIGGGITPEVPEEVTHELQARINILKWKVVSQNVSFGE